MVQGGHLRYLVTMRHPVAAFGVLTTLVSGCLAQEPGQERPSPAVALQQKLASPFLRHADWTTDYDAALRTATAEKKLILGYFTTAYY